MNNVDNDILTVKIAGGGNIDILILDIIEISGMNKKYIVYSLLESDDDNIFVSILNEGNESYSLDTIEDENELKMVVEYLTKINSDNEEGD